MILYHYGTGRGWWSRAVQYAENMLTACYGHASRIAPFRARSTFCEARKHSFPPHSGVPNKQHHTRTKNGKRRILLIFSINDFRQLMLENATSIIEQCPKSQKPRTKGNLSLSLYIAFPVQRGGVQKQERVAGRPKGSASLTLAATVSNSPAGAGWHVGLLYEIFRSRP